MTLSETAKEVIFNALRERVDALSELKRTGLTQAIRETAEREYNETHKAWEEFERERRNKN